MRSASRVFHGIALFAVVAALLFGIGSGFDNVQGLTILGFFAGACAYLGYLLGRQAQFDLAGFPPREPEGEGGEIHLPGPSWYPALYGVAGGLAVLGLVFSWAVFAAGAALIVLTTIGWIRESVVEYRREVAHAHPSSYDAPSREVVDIAHRVAAFRTAHGHTDAVVQHVGRGKGEVVLVGADGGWGNFGVPDVGAGRQACALAGAVLHESWPAGLGQRIAPDAGLWRRMAGASPFHAPDHDAPRDGATQTGARVFLAIGVFALAAGALYYLPQRSWSAIQGTSILTCFALANFYLYVALRNAKARPEESRFADAQHVTREPTQPPALDPETLHLPGPSWWPAAFSVAGGAVVLGLVLSWPVFLSGMTLLVVSAIGWTVESVREYRAHLAHHGSARH